MNITGIRIKQVRKERKLTQEALAIEINKRTGKTFTKTTISNYENEISSPSNEILSVISDILCVSTDYLLGRSDFPELTAEQDIELTEEAQGILNEINKLDPETRKEAWEQLEMFLQYKKTKNKS